MLEQLLKMLGFKPEHIDEVLLQCKVMASAVTSAVSSTSTQQNDIAFIAAYYRAQIMRHAKVNPDDNDMLLIDGYYPVHNPLPTDEENKELEAVNDLQIANPIATSNGENGNIGKS